MFHRYFRAKVDGFVIRMEKEAMRLVEITNNQRRNMPVPPPPNKPATPRPTPAQIAAAAQARANATPQGKGGV